MSISNHGVNVTTLSYVPYLAAKQKTIQLDTFAGMFSVRQTRHVPNSAPSQRNTNKRGRVNQFSRRSRKRMVDAMAKKREYERVIFVTLTYTDEVFFDGQLTPKTVKRDLNVLMKRFIRDKDNLQTIWKIEWKRRKSGDNVGQLAPHFHLLIDGYMDDIADLRRDLGKDWYEILKVHNELTPKPRIDVQTAKNRRHAGYYVSKYVAKSDEINLEELRESEDRIEAWLSEAGNSLGRHWGKSRNWNVEKGDTFELSEEQFIQMKRYIRKWSKRRNRRYARILRKLSKDVGFSCYGLGDELTCPDDTLPLYRLIEHIKEMYPSEIDVVF